MQEIRSVGDVIDIVRRRKWSLILPPIVVFLGALVVSVVLPQVYRSTSTILIEQQGIPKEYVASVVTSYAEQRLQSINQRIMSSTRLLEIINRFNLYAELRRKRTIEEVIAEMKKNIKFATVSAEVGERALLGGSKGATIAFTLSYQGERPDIVQQVANVLASLYLEENLKVREQQTAGALKFLNDEAKELQAHLSELEGRISQLKSTHPNELPELFQFNLTGIDRIERDMERLVDQLQVLKERETYLQSQLATMPQVMVNPSSPAVTVNRDKEMLRDLKTRLSQLESRFSPKYPDVVKAKVEIAQLEKRIEESDKKEAEAEAEAPKTPEPTGTKNPAYVTLSSQLATAQSEIESTKRQLNDLDRKRDDYLKRIEASPKVEEAYKALVVDRDNTKAKYEDLLRKTLEAKVAQGMEKEQMGERFTLIDPARLPEKPLSPNVPAILLIGLVLGIGTGVGLVALREYADESVRSAASLALATSLPVLVTVPHLLTDLENLKTSRRRKMIAAGAVITMTVCVVGFHLFVMDLDVFWARLMRRLNF